MGDAKQVLMPSGGSTLLCPGGSRTTFLRSRFDRSFPLFVDLWWDRRGRPTTQRPRGLSRRCLGWGRMPRICGCQRRGWGRSVMKFYVFTRWLFWRCLRRSARWGTTPWRRSGSGVVRWTRAMPPGSLGGMMGLRRWRRWWWGQRGLLRRVLLRRWWAPWGWR